MPGHICSTLPFYDGDLTVLSPLAWKVFTMFSATVFSSKIRSFATLAAFTALLGCTSAMAQPKPGEGASGGRNGPPAEALTACKSAKAGDSCTFSSPNGNVTGSCMAPQGRALACAPAQGQDGNASSAPKQ